MLYQKNNPILQIVGVEHLKWGKGTFNVKPREYSALAFRIKGTATITVGNEQYFVNTNDVLYLPQKIRYIANYSDTETIVFHFVTLHDDSEAEVYTFKNTEKIYKLFLQALVDWNKKEPYSCDLVTAGLYAIRGALLKQETKAKLPQNFLEAVSFINSNYKNSNVSIDMICAECGIAATVLRQNFKRFYQKTPTEYITELRLEYARNLISCGTTIEEASQKSGFNDSKYFARVVKKRFGVTPRTFKSYGR